ncbi:uncharacterized protein [Penaeus vannamei]|uniref:uncharacterized protein n=1 Tax=Penaeus vannamei TaxID=6689 RepID=UPI00387F9232
MTPGTSAQTHIAGRGTARRVMQPHPRQHSLEDPPEETLDATDACRATRLTGDRDLHRSQVTAIRLVSGQFVSGLAVRERWVEYFEQLYQVDSPTVNFNASSAEIPLPDPTISEDPPSLTEVWMVISKLKSGKAAGNCGIPAELLKAGGEPMARGLHATICQSGTIPNDLLRGVVIPLWKCKGNRRDCSNHLGIILLSISGKVLAHILLRCTRDHLLRHHRSE